MDAKSGNGSSGNFLWGLIAGLVAVVGAGGLYLSGVFTSEPEPEQPVQEQVAAVPAPESQTTEDSGAQSSGDDDAAQAQVDDDATQTSQQSSDAAAEEPAAETTEQATAEPEDTTEAETAPATDDTEEAASPLHAAPVLDQIFVEKDGNALLSGDARPGSRVRVLLNGTLLHEFTVEDSGQFAEFVTIPFSENAQGLVLETSDGEQVSRSDDYLIAALPKPVEEQIASVDTPAQAEDVPTDSAQQPEITNEGEGEAQSEETASTTPAEPLAEDTDENQQIAVLRSGEEGVELVQTPELPSDEPEQVALDTIGYSDTGDVQLTGRAPDGSGVRLYLDNQLVADLPPTEGGDWRGEIEGIDPGVYTLRVDEVNTDGTVLSRVETPFKREPVEALQAAEAINGGQSPDESAPIRSVTVQKGDTLWAISRDRFGDGVLYVKLFDANRELIRDPDLIYPGQIFAIPE